MLDWSGFLINSHDPLRVHVLKHIRQNSLTSLRYSVTEQGKWAGCQEFIKINDGFMETRTSASDRGCVKTGFQRRRQAEVFLPR